MAADTSTAIVDIDVKIEKVGPAKKRLTITVPAKAIDEKLETSMLTLATEAALPGFRKGRVPKALLERRFGSQVKTETRNQVVADAYSTAIEREKLSTVSDPEPVGSIEELEVAAGKPLIFSVDVEVVPEFQLPEVKGMKIIKPTMEIGDDLVDDELRRQSMNLGEPQPVEKKFEAGDRLVGPIKAAKKGEPEPFFAHDNALVMYPAEADGGRGNVLGLLIENLGSLLKDKRVGDVVTISTVGPELHEREDLRGAPIEIEFTIREATRIIPVPVSKVVEHYMMSSEQMLREQIKLALEGRRDNEQASVMREQVYEHLNGIIDFELPERMTEKQTDRMLKMQEMELLYRGMEPEQVEQKLAEARSQTADLARTRLKLFFLLHQFATEMKVSVSEQEINARIAEIAAQRSVRPEKLRNDLVQSGRLNDIAMQLREHKAADQLLAKATIEEVSAEEWRKIVAEKTKSTGTGRSASGSPGKSPSKKPSAKADSAPPKRAEGAKPPPKTSAKPEAKAAPAKKSSSKKK